MQILQLPRGSMHHHSVIPVKAGIQADFAPCTKAAWTPAFAGVAGDLREGEAAA